MNRLSLCSLSIAAALVLCGPVLAGSTECDDAVAACKEKCGGLKVYDYEARGFTANTIFKDACEYVCTRGLKPCQEQNSALGCDTFMNRCVSDCPWKVRNRNTTDMNPSTDAFYQCGTACFTGHNACEESRKKSPQARARTGTFYTCTEAQSACYTTCMGLVPVDANGIRVPSDFPDLCAEACAAGVAPCNDNGDKHMCGYYYGSCARACPDAQYDEEFDEFYSETERGKACMQSCAAGADYCGMLQ